MAMTTSQLSIVVKSQGVEKAADDLVKLAKAASSVDAETKAFVIAQQKLDAANTKTSKSSELLEVRISRQKQAMEAANIRAERLAAASANLAAKQETAASSKLAKELERQEQASMRAAAAMENQERQMVKQHMQALKMNDAYDKHAKGLDEVTRRGNVYINTLRSMATAALAYVGVNFFTDVVKQADAWSMMQSKLSLAVGGMEAAKRAQTDLYEISQRLRVPIEDTTKLFTRMSVPLQKMGKGIIDTKEVVTSFSTALKLAGATGQEASSAMLQFSQSLNAGRLNGGEFNSIAEASPNVLRAIEVELVRVGRGAELSSRGLKKMAADGKLSTDVLVEALQRAAPKWNKEFETLPLTVDGAMTRIKNAWQKAIGEVGQDTKFNEKMAESLKKLEDMLPNIARLIGNTFTFLINNGDKLLAIFTGLGIVITGLKIGTMVTAMQAAAMAINATTGAAAGLRGALLAIGITPVGLAVTALGVALGALYLTMGKFAESSSNAEKESKKLADASAKLSKESDNENYYLAKQISLLDRAALSQEELNRLKLEGLATGSQSRISAAADILQKAEIDFMKAKKSWDEVKGNKSIGDSGKFREFKAAEEAMKSAQEAFGKLQTSEAQITEKKLKEQNLLQKKSREEYEAEIKRGALTERQLLEAKYLEEVKSTEEKHSKLQNSESSHQLALATIKRKYLEDLEKLDKASSPDKYKALRESTIAYANTLEELRQKYVELEKFGVDDKRTQSEKERTKLQLEYAQATDKVVKAEKAKQLAVASQKVVLEDAIILEAKRQKDYQDTLESLTKEAEALTKSAEQQEMLSEAYGKSEGELLKLRAEKEENKLTDMAQRGLNDELLAQQQKIVDALQREAKARDELGVKKDSKELADKYEADYQAANKKIADGLYNAIGKGGESAIKKLIQDIKSWFARLVLSPIINPISQLGASIISPNAASAQGGVTNVMELGSTIYKSITTGFSAMQTSLATTVGEIGASMGSEFMLSVSSMMQGGASSGAAGMVASAANMMPYVAAAVAAFRGVKAINGDYRLGGLSADAGALLGIAPRLFGMKEKEFAAQTVTGNLGTNDLTRNQAWTQSGGLFRSDRADTWKYRLTDSTATTADGKSYQDSASMTTDKALLTQLNSMYDAVKIATTGYAKALGINADSIKERTDAINFTFGKTAEETSANISKAFESITNTIAGDLLGNLKELALQNETAAQTMGRLATNISATNGMFKALGYNLFDLNVNGIKAADSIVTLFGGLDKFQSIASDYYDKFYSEAEKSKVKVDAVTASLKELGIELPPSREAFRNLVEAAQKAGNNELFVSLMKLSNAFADITESSITAAKQLPENVMKMFEGLSTDAQKWLGIRNKATSLKDSISTAMGNPQKDPAIRMQQLWDAMSKDITPEQKLELAGELKDLTLAKYQLEKDSMTKLIDFGKQLKGYVEGLKLGALSPLTVGQKLAEAQAQYQSTLAKAQAGDTNAQGALSGKADAYLSIAQTALASSGGYIDIFNSVTGSLDALGVESMSAAEQANSIASGQLSELQRLSDFISGIEMTADSYYNSSLVALSTQITLMDAMYQKMGIFDGMLASIAGLPAEIAASLSGSATASVSNDKFIRDLYQSVEGKVGSQVDQAGYQYWMKDLQTQTREQVGNNFVMASAQNAQAGVVQNNTAALETQISELSLEIKGLREDQNKQTGASIDAALITSANSTQAIVEAIREVNKGESWDSQVKAELV